MSPREGDHSLLHACQHNWLEVKGLKFVYPDREVVLHSIPDLFSNEIQGEFLIIVYRETMFEAYEDIKPGKETFACYFEAHCLSYLQHMCSLRPKICSRLDLLV